MACIIFSVIAKANPSFDKDLTAAAMVWSYIGQVVFSVPILAGTIKMSDGIVKEMMGLGKRDKIEDKKKSGCITKRCIRSN